MSPIIHGDCTDEAWKAATGLRVSFNVFACRKDETIADERRDGVPPHRLGDIAGWAFARGHDTVLIELAADPHPGTPGVTHHVCSDPACPGGC